MLTARPWDKRAGGLAVCWGLPVDWIANKMPCISHVLTLTVAGRCVKKPRLLHTVRFNQPASPANA